LVINFEMYLAFEKKDDEIYFENKDDEIEIEMK
jgi:hypothetical protein